MNTVIKPSLDMLSDPDFINQTIVWLYQDYQVKSDLFLQTVRLSESLEELQATRDAATREINLLRQNDSKSEADSSMKQQGGRRSHHFQIYADPLPLVNATRTTLRDDLQMSPFICTDCSSCSKSEPEVNVDFAENFGRPTGSTTLTFEVPFAFGGRRR